jgi:hypothetical protein
MARKPTPRIDVSSYFAAIPNIFKRPSILAMPLLAAVIEIIIDQITPFFTDAVGGLGAGLFSLLVQLVYLWAFGVTIIQASNILRGRRGTFDEAWDEGRVKLGDILMAAIGFQFVVWAASYIGSFFGAIGLLLGAVAAFFLIYTIPAAAIGGMPGQMAISASIRAVRANPGASIVLAIVFFALWFAAIPLGLPYLLQSLPLLTWQLVTAAVRALVLAYLAFPFAKQYDDVAFRGFW